MGCSVNNYEGTKRRTVSLIRIMKEVPQSLTNWTWVSLNEQEKGMVTLTQILYQGGKGM